jgi:hypothetical protein
MRHKAVGILPSKRWLRAHGYIGLDKAMKAHPAAFAHIRQDKRRRRTQDWVHYAETVAARHGGSLPRQGVLQESYPALYRYKLRHAHLFARIPQARSQLRSCQEYVALAEQLANAHDGSLPNTAWLQHHHRNLEAVMRRNPQQFAHIPQVTKRGRTCSEWVAYAEQVAITHGGTLPSPSQLKTHGHLVGTMQKWPTRFRHIPQARSRSRRRSPAAWVPVADRLAKQNHGRLPSTYWLRRSDYKGLETAMRKHPHLFAHLKP